MVIFDLNLTQVDVFPDVIVTNEPVKYLDAYLGLGSKVEQMNFDIIFNKMKDKISQWQHRVISLEAREFHFPLGWPCLEKKFPSKIGKYAKKLLKKQLIK